MAFQDTGVDLLDRALDGQGLLENVHAVGVAFEHFLYGTGVPLD